MVSKTCESVAPVSVLPPLKPICCAPSSGVTPELGPLARLTVPGPPATHPVIFVEPLGRTSPGGESLGDSKLPFWNAAAFDSSATANIESASNKGPHEVKKRFI